MSKSYLLTLIFLTSFACFNGPSFSQPNNSEKNASSLALNTVLEIDGEPENAGESIFFSNGLLPNNFYGQPLVIELPNEWRGQYLAQIPLPVATIAWHPPALPFDNK